MKGAVVTEPERRRGIGRGTRQHGGSCGLMGQAGSQRGHEEEDSLTCSRRRRQYHDADRAKQAGRLLYAFMFEGSPQVADGLSPLLL